MSAYFVSRHSCPACKSTDHKTIYSCSFLESPVREYLESFYSTHGRIEFEYLTGAKFILIECIDCGMVYQKEIPNDFLMKVIYGDWVGSETAPPPKNLDYYSAYAQEVMMLIAYFNTMPNELKFLDFAMGWGRWFIMAKAFGCDCYGTELSETKIEYAKSQCMKVVSWDDISNCSFDFINTEQVFEHLSEPLKTLCYLKKSLKAGGLIKINVPNGSDIKRRLKISDWRAPKGHKNSLNPISPLEHINCFDRTSIIRMADKAGLEVVRVPLTIQYAYTTNWKLFKPMIKNILRPLYRSVFRKGTKLFLRRKTDFVG